MRRPDAKAWAHQAWSQHLKYSISHKNEAGVTLHSEWLAFKVDSDALAYTKESAAEDALTEVWKGDHLLARFERGAGETDRVAILAADAA